MRASRVSRSGCSGSRSPGQCVGVRFSPPPQRHSFLDATPRQRRAPWGSERRGLPGVPQHQVLRVGATTFSVSPGPCGSSGCLRLLACASHTGTGPAQASPHSPPLNPSPDLQVLGQSRGTGRRGEPRTQLHLKPGSSAVSSPSVVPEVTPCRRQPTGQAWWEEVSRGVWSPRGEGGGPAALPVEVPSSCPPAGMISPHVPISPRPPPCPPT